jgi:hypothetical protein
MQNYPSICIGEAKANTICRFDLSCRLQMRFSETSGMIQVDKLVVIALDAMLGHMPAGWASCPWGVEFEPSDRFEFKIFN